MNVFERIVELQAELERINQSDSIGINFKCALILAIQALKGLRIFL